MYVRNYLMLLIFGCSVCSLAVFFILGFFFNQEEFAAARVNNGALVLRDLERIESGFSQWLLLSDLVIGSDESYLTDGAIQLSKELIEVTQQLRSELNDGGSENVDAIEQFILRQRGRLQECQSLDNDSRSVRLAQLLEEMDAESPACIQAIESMRLKLESEQQMYTARFDSIIKVRRKKTVLLLLGYFVCVACLWQWISRMLTKPLSQLTLESQQAKKEQRKVEIVHSGPMEVRQLSRSLSDLVVSLTEQIEEHQRTRAERQRLHRELIDTSRKAGMAEVASEVLHNVGNVLNSMNVSATVISKQLNDSVLERMLQINDMLNEHQADLPRYLANDERGKQVPQAISFLTTRLANEREKQLAEVKLLQDSISHVRKVIQNQQAFARVANVMEPIGVTEIVEEAIRLNGKSSTAAHVKVIRELDTEIEIRSDRHKIQQILVNLISNAIDATMNNQVNNRIIRIGLKVQEKDVCIEVTDNGIGITADQLKKVFTHGFTTKKTGHGFGLHSSAIAAKVLGGSLRVQSEGAGLGATFLLTIPQETQASSVDNQNSQPAASLPIHNTAKVPVSQSVGS